MSVLPVKFMQEEGASCSHLEREMRVVRRLNGYVQYGGQHCIKGVPPLVPLPYNQTSIQLSHTHKKKEEKHKEKTTNSKLFPNWIVSFSITVSNSQL